MLRTPLPPSWKIAALEDVAEVQTGIAKGKVINGAGVRLPYLRVANVQDGYVDLSVIKEITVKPSEVQRYSLRAGDVLFTEGGDFDKLGRGTVWNGEIEPCLHQNHIFSVRPNRKKLLPDFLAFQAASTYGRHYFQLSSKQSTNLASINSTQLKQFPVLLPPLPEQRKIAAILRTWDEGIAVTGKLIASKKATLSWIRQNICTGNIRLSGFKEPWRKNRLADILNEHGDRSSGKEDVCSVSVHKGVINQIEHLGRSFSAKDTSNYNLVHHGDVIYTKSPTGDFPLGIIKQSRTAENVIVSPLYGVFSPPSVALGIILDCYFESPVYTENYLKPLVQKGAKNTLNITNKRFLEGVLLLPENLQEQQKIASLIEVCREEITILQKQLTTLQSQKRGLMQKLLTGNLQVEGE